MNAPRLEINLDAVSHNTQVLVDRMASLGVTVCGVTKATLGHPDVGRAMLAGGVSSLGDSRIENVERLRRAGVLAPILLTRSPMVSQVDRVVAGADASLNSELEVIELLSAAAVRQNRVHLVVLMVELGDRREGVMPSALLELAGAVLALPGVALHGIGTNLACQNGVIPDAINMTELSELANYVESEFAITLDIVSGGNSSNLGWVFDPASEIGRINHLRLGESILLGVDPVSRAAIDGLGRDAFTLVGEVIESQSKPSRPRGTIGPTSFADRVEPSGSDRAATQVLVAIGEQDVDPRGLTALDGATIAGASSDHLVLRDMTVSTPVGTDVKFRVDYAALLRAMTSPFVAQHVVTSETPGSSMSPARPTG